MLSHKNRYTVATLFFLALFLLSIFFYLLFFFSRTTLHPPLSHHTDLYLHLHLQPSPLPSPPPQQPPPPPPPPHSSTTIQPPPATVSAADHKSVPVTHTDTIDNAAQTLKKECDLFTGTWVEDENYPIYQPGSCPYVDEAYDCQINGRTDTHYTKWRWKPYACDLPRFSAKDFLARLKGKRLMLVGDSMNRNQFESILCILREGLHNKSKMYEIHGHKITKGRGYFNFKFEACCTASFSL